MFAFCVSALTLVTCRVGRAHQSTRRHRWWARPTLHESAKPSHLARQGECVTVCTDKWSACSLGRLTSGFVGSGRLDLRPRWPILREWSARKHPRLRFLLRQDANMFVFCVSAVAIVTCRVGRAHQTSRRHRWWARPTLLDRWGRLDPTARCVCMRLKHGFSGMWGQVETTCPIAVCGLTLKSMALGTAHPT